MVFLKKERARLNEKLVNTAELVKQTEARLTEFEERLGELNEQEKLVRGSLARQHGTLIKLLAAMQRMGRNPLQKLVGAQRFSKTPESFYQKRHNLLIYIWKRQSR